MLMPAGNTIATATSLNLSSSNLQITGDSVTASTADYYTFQLFGRSSLNFSLKSLSSGSDVNFDLLGSDGTTLIRQGNNSGTITDSINLFDQSASTYYLKVYTNSPTPANYTLNLLVGVGTNLLWRNYGTPGESGNTALWEMNGVSPTTRVNLPTVADLNWQLAATADFNQDGQADLVWRNYGVPGSTPDAGKVAIWLMNGSNPTATIYTNFVVADANWRLEGVADFNGDRNPDLLWRNYSAQGISPDAGKVAIWTMNGVNPVTTVYAPFVVADVNWRIEGVADFNGDGNPDLAWRNYGTQGSNPDAGKVAIWTMSNVNPVTTVYAPFVVADVNWRIEGVADFNGDGNPDLAWRNYGTQGSNPDAGKVAIWTMAGVNPLQTIFTPFLVSDPNWRLEGVRDGFNNPPRLDLAGNLAATAFDIGEVDVHNGTFSDRLTQTDPTDIYRFNLTTNRTINLVLDGLEAAVNVQLFRDANNNGVIDSGEAIALTFQDVGDSKTSNPSLLAGTYFMQVSLANTGATNYTLIVDGATQFNAQPPVQFPASFDEISGLVKGAGDYWWVIEDSSNAASIRAIDNSGNLLREVTINGATNIDWEEITVGPNPNGSGRVLFIGDFGNNTSNLPPRVSTRTNQAIYMIAEPSLTDTSVNILSKLEIDFPSGNYDIEAMVYDAQKQELVLITKDLDGVAVNGGISRVFTRSLNPAQTVLTEVATFDLRNRPLTNTQLGNYGLDRLVTGAALSDDGRVLIVRTYESAFRWVRAANESWQSLFTRPPQVIDLVAEEQGEAIAFSGNDFYTISERDPDLIRYSVV
jgi:hypothetical protein